MSKRLHYARQLRRMLPTRAEYRLRSMLYRFLPVRHRSRFTTVSHCCVWKTASQWVRLILSDARIYMYSGLKPVVFSDLRTEARRSQEDEAHIRLPEGRIVTPIYCRYDEYEAFRKPTDSRAFFIARDPRDILVSWYFSNRY